MARTRAPRVLAATILVALAVATLVLLPGGLSASEAGLPSSPAFAAASPMAQRSLRGLRASQPSRVARASATGTREMVSSLIASQLNIDSDLVKEDTSLMELLDFGVDSIALAESTLAIEEEFQVSLHDVLAPGMLSVNTVGYIADLVESKLPVVATVA